MLRSLLTVSGVTLISRVAGFLRESIMAHYLGTSRASDAFLAAFRFPNMFRRIFGEGAFNSAFVPMFGRKLQEETKEAAEEFATNAFSWLVYILLIASLIIIPGMRWFMGVMAFGFLIPDGEFTIGKFASMMVYPHGTAQFELAVNLGRIMFSYLLCMSLTAHLSGVLNTLKSFAIPSFVAVFLSVFTILFLLVGVPLYGYQKNLEGCATIAAWAATLSGFAQVIVVYFACRRRGMNIRIKKPRLNTDIKKLSFLMVPGIIAAGIQQVNLVIGLQFATSVVGATAKVNYADRLFQLPLSILGTAFGLVILPQITRFIRSDRYEDAKGSVSTGISLAMLVTMPAAIALITIPNEIVALVFERGQFNAVDTQHVAAALAAFSFGLPAYVLAKVIQPAYFARENTKTPMKIAAVVVIVDIICLVLLFSKYQHVGVATATTIAGWVNVFLLWYFARDFVQLSSDAKNKIVRIVLASLGMGLVLFGAKYGYQKLMHGDYMLHASKTIVKLAKLACTGGLIGLGALVYFTLAFLFKATSIKELKSSFSRS